MKNTHMLICSQVWCAASILAHDSNQGWMLVMGLVWFAAYAFFSLNEWHYSGSKPTTTPSKEL